MFFKKFLLPLSILFLFTACQPEIGPQISATIEKVKNTLLPTSTKKKSTFISEERKSDSYIPDIEGTYNLIEGFYSYGEHGVLNKEKIKDSTIVIEKLSETEFGFYYVTRLENTLTTSYFGGFTYKDDKFYQKVIDYPSTNTLLRDNITLKKKGNLLRLIVESTDEQRTILWGLSSSGTPSLAEKLDEEKNNYMTLYKEKLF